MNSNVDSLGRESLPAIFTEHSGVAAVATLARNCSRALSPSALAHWPAVARQMSDSGVLGAVDEESLVLYREAFAKWCSAGGWACDDAGGPWLDGQR